MNIALAASAGSADGANFFGGGDFEVYIGTRQWQRHKAEADVLEYDIMQAPHHCSWHSLSYDSWSDYREKADRKSTRLNSSHSQISYAVFCLKKKKKK